MKTDSSCFCAFCGRWLSLKKSYEKTCCFFKDEKQTLSNRLAYESSELAVFELAVFELAVFELALPLLALTTLGSSSFLAASDLFASFFDYGEPYLRRFRQVVSFVM